MPTHTNKQIGELLSDCLKETRSFEAGERLIIQGDPNHDFCRVAEGELAISQKTSDGAELVLAFNYPGDLLFSTAPGKIWTYSVRALSNCQLEFYHLDAMRKDCHADGQLAYELFLAACRVLSQGVEESTRLRRLSVEARFATFLLDAGGRIGTARGRGLVLSLPMTRTDIASYLSLRSETLSRIIRRWRDRGLIDLESFRQVSIGDVAELEVVAQDLAPSSPATVRSA